MADAIVSFLIQELGSVIKQEIEQEVRLVVGVRTEVRRLQKTFETLQTVLNEAEQRQMNDASVKIWLDNLKNAAYGMEDVVDEWATEIRLLQLEKKNHEVSSSFPCTLFFSCFKQTALRHKIGSRIKAIRETLDFIREEKDQFRFSTSERVRDGPQTIRTETSYIIVDPDICGRDYDKNIILNKLLGSGSSTISYQNDERSDPRIISIIGMGGLGKTTLAQLVFNHDSIKSHFEIPMWVCVSDPFDRTMVAKAIIREATKKDTQTLEWNALHRELCDSIKGKKFILVLDDVSTKDPKKLDPLKHLLALGAEGSRMLVTTRNESVASSINSWKYKLEKLSPTNSRSLLCRKAFCGYENKEDPVLNKISFGISDKCCGLPLALSLLGSLLNKRIDEENWGRILNSKFWELKGFDHNQKLLNPAFLLSYDGLSSSLKNCFAYCSTFQKDKKIKKRTLINLWMAQGLINSKEPELLGEEYIDELASHSFFQDFSEDNKGNIFFKMHDLIHDFAQFLTTPCYISLYNDEKILFNQENSGSNPIHLSFKYDELNSKSVGFFHESIRKVCNIRTLQTVQSWRGRECLFEFGNLSSDLINHLKCLRVLKMKHMGITQLPDEIYKLIHLRYLDLSGNYVLSELPKSVGRLINLQTLKLKDCDGLHQLPGEMKGMISLRNLDIRGCYRMKYLPKVTGNWKYLQSLSTFILSDTSEGCKLEELKYQNLLKYRLEIYGLEILKATQEAAEAQLHKKSQLIELMLDFKPTGGTPFGQREGDVLEQTPEDVLAESVLGVLQPHSNLKKLTVSNYLGFKFPSWMSNTKALSHLRCLELKRCIHCSELPVLGLLPSLEVLGIYQLLNLKHIGVEIYGGGKCIPQVAFPKLKTLNIDFASSLEVWEFGNEHVKVTSIFPCVTSIHLNKCRKLIALPALGELPSLQTLSVSGSDQLVSISDEFCGTLSHSLTRLTAFPKLNSLMIFGLANLEVVNLCGMPCLQILDIKRCPKLNSLTFRIKSLPSLEKLNLVLLTNLREFIVQEEDDEEDGDLQLPRLLKVQLAGCDNLRLFPRHRLIQESLRHI
ncbi:putative disease resistance protein RGA1 [Papaver somniferum]|uniref:putative disease resistance protein RGA1 n=1 Tax=Papaver somniferum TaxID=3469 RepID=UPI000E6FF728|nr:putative disease resistance protein RGA1 [Papaver somniferum]